jgi:hypothetical protein
MLKILQVFTVVIFALIFIIGILVLVFAPYQMPTLIQFGGYILPAWLFSITAAFLGKPITEAAAGLRAKLETKTITETKTDTTAVGAVTETKTEIETETKTAEAEIGKAE